MKFAGIQKVTLLDYPGHIACTVFTRGCNFKCPFCHNMELVTKLTANTDIDEEEILQFLITRQGILHGICITGGEPLMHKNIFDFMKKVKQLGYKIKLDTNGTFPEGIKKVIDEKLVDKIAMDIKSDEENYKKVSGAKVNLSKIKESIILIMQSSIEYEFRTTCVKGLHTIENFYGIAQMINGAKEYYIQNYRYVENVTPKEFKSFSKEELEQFKNIVKEKVKCVEIRGIA